MPSFPFVDAHLRVWDQSRLLDRGFADLGLSAAEIRAICHDNANQFLSAGPVNGGGRL
jgi:hypothetical protein